MSYSELRARALRARAGDNISVTQGVVSRVDISDYAHSAETLLVIQIDAAINPGNRHACCYC